MGLCRQTTSLCSGAGRGNGQLYDGAVAALPGERIKANNKLWVWVWRFMLQLWRVASTIHYALLVQLAGTLSTYRHYFTGTT